MGKKNVLICGATGYIGLQLTKLLCKHKKISIKYLCGSTSVGKKIDTYEQKLKKYKLKRDKNINLLSVGSIIERKNYHYLLNELRYMDKIKLNIVGDITRESKYYNRLLKIISNYRLSKKVKFHSNVSTNLLSKLYSKCDFYVSVSKYEGFGMSLANALQLKKMIITYKTKTIMSTLKKDGIIYLNNFKEKSLSKLITKNAFNSDLSKKLSQNKRKFLTPIQSGDLFIKIIKDA